MIKSLCSKCLRRACICSSFAAWATIAVFEPFAGDGLELPPEHAPAAITGAMNTVSMSTTHYVTYDEITGKEHSAAPLQEYALSALRTPGPAGPRLTISQGFDAASSKESIKVFGGAPF